MPRWKVTVSSTEGGGDGSPARVRISASLMVAGASTPLWSKTFNGRLGDLPRLEGEMAQAIAAAVRASITSKELTTFSRSPQTSPAAEEAYFRGRLELEGYGAAAARRAIDAFERVLSLEPDHPGAHVGAAYAYTSLAANGGTTHQKARAVALDHVKRALAVQDDLAEAHAAMGDLEFRYDWNIKAAEEEYRKALDLNPSLARARNEYAQLLAASKRFDEALAQASLFEATEPGAVPSPRGLLLYYKGDYKAAEQVLRRATTERFDAAGPHIQLGRVAEAQGRLPEAIEETRIALQLSKDGGVPLRVQMVRLEALSGRPDEARRLLRELQAEASRGSLRLASRDLAYILLALGDHEGALQAFARALDEVDPSMVWLGVDPRVDSLRPDPRFTAMLNQLGLR